MSRDEAVQYLAGLLGKTLRVQISDRRLFTGQFKCTDKDKNIILANAHEYREPSQAALEAAAVEASPSNQAKVVADMTSRFVGLIVVPGEHIVRMELEEYDPAGHS